MQKQTVQSADGTELAVYKWTSTNNNNNNNSSSKAQLLISHGYLEHGQRYREFAEVMANKYSIDVTVYDYRGHGHSKGAKALCSNWKQYHEDLEAVMKTLKNDSLPKFVLGHSNGGLVCLDYFLEHSETVSSLDVKGLLITSPFLGPAAKLSCVKKQLSRLLGRFFPSLTLPVSEDEISGETLSRDPVKIKEHDEDELNLNALTVGWAYQAMSAQDRVLNNTKSISVPLFFAYAELDQVADPALNREFSKKVSATDKTVMERKGCRHEVLNEINREDLYETIAEWILARAK